MKTKVDKRWFLVLIIILACVEYNHINIYNNPPIKHPSVVYQPLPIRSSQSNRYCPDCGIILKGNYCHECGKKVEY